MEANAGFNGWGILELMGHVRLAGKISQEENFGTKLGRIDIPRRDKCPNEACAPDLTQSGNDRHDCPTCKGSGFVDAFTTQYFGGSSVYRLTPVTEEIARQVAISCRPEPVHAWELPRQLPSPVHSGAAVDDDEF